MKLNKLLLVSIILLAILTFGAVNAEDTASDDLTAVDGGDIEIDSSLADEIDVGGDIATDASSSDVADVSDSASDNYVNNDSNTKSKLGSSDEDVLGDYDYIVTPESYYELDLDSTFTAGNYKFEGEFEDFPSYFEFEDGCVVDADSATFINTGISLQGNVQINGLTIIATETIPNTENALVYVTGDDNTLDGLTVEYTPGDDDDAYAIYIKEAENFKLLNSDVTFTGSSLAENYEYAMKIINSNQGLVQGNVIRANLPILDVDYNKGNPGLDTDLVLNTGIKNSQEIDIINNTFIANVIDRQGSYPTLDCVMIEGCDGVNIIGNTFNETDFITNEGDPNYLNVLDMYYTNNTLVQDNKISVETNGGDENAGTSYCVQLTGPYENVVIDGNDLYSNCRGPALGVFSQNYYGGTELLVQNNDIDVTGLPTRNSWGLVSGIELQDDVARVYNNTIVTKSIVDVEDEMNIYGISYAQALNENHNYDIRDNTVETEGKYTIYLLKAQDTVVAGNSLVSSSFEGDDSVYIRNADGNTVIENNTGASETTNIVTPENFFEFFNDEGILDESIPFDELIFKGDFENIGVDKIIIESPITITGDDAVLINIPVEITSDDVELNNLTFIGEGSLGVLIGVYEAINVNLVNLDVSYTTEDEMGVAIDIANGNANILNSTIFFESHVTSDAVVSVAIQVVDSDDTLIDNNNITTKLPCVYVYSYDEDYYLMGSNNVNPVRLKDCNNLVLTNNNINSTTNNYSADFPTIQSIYIIGCSDEYS